MGPRTLWTLVSSRDVEGESSTLWKMAVIVYASSSVPVASRRLRSRKLFRRLRPSRSSRCRGAFQVCSYSLNVLTVCLLQVEDKGFNHCFSGEGSSNMPMFLSRRFPPSGIGYVWAEGCGRLNKHKRLVQKGLFFSPTATINDI